jgi:hypothetical protein
MMVGRNAPDPWPGNQPGSAERVRRIAHATETPSKVN